MAMKARDSADDLCCLLLGIPAQEEFAETAALRYATELAAAAGAELSLYVLPPPLLQPFPLTAGSSTIWVAQEAERLERQSAATRRGATATIAREGVQLFSEHAHSRLEPGDQRFVQLARVHDLTILAAAGASEPLARRAIEDALFDSGRPVLVVPERGDWPKPPRRVAIAWDGSARAARAVKDAMGLLARAEMVVAVTVAGEKDLSRMAPGADLATYLARHGIECKILTMAGERRDVGGRMRLFAAEDDIDLIVMGAFVHSRFRAVVFGGVTRSLLDDCQVPLFLAH